MAYAVRIVLRKYKPNSMGYHILQLCVTKNSCRKRISLKLYVDPAYWDNSA
uniref:Arm DNA-binding domain-containing protein n=1 Tax=Alistipes finegoldii TaxID=214856 RepID=UPI0025A18AD8